jgi:hypothetical protein
MPDDLFLKPDYEAGKGGAAPKARRRDMEDGSTVFDFSDEPDAPQVSLKNAPHDVNLADGYIPDDELSRIAEELLTGIEADKESRQEWWDAYNKGRELLGIRSEDRTWPFKHACGAYFPILAEAAVRFQSNAHGELLPAAGPVKAQIVGDLTPEAQRSADAVEQYMNYYLTDVDGSYYPQMDQLLFMISLAGSMFKKTYRDPLKERPVSPLIHPEHLIVSYNSSSLEDAGRVTNEVHYLRSQMIKLQLAGFYREIDLAEPTEDGDPVTDQTDHLEGLAKVMPDGDERYTVYEVHVDLDIDVDGIRHTTKRGKATGLPLPYIVSIDRDSREVLSIRRNWKKGDAKFLKKEWFTHWVFFPGQGFYGYGYIHLLGGACKVITNIMRQLHDTGMLNSFPAGFRVKGATRMEQNMQPFGPTEWREIDTNGMPLNQAILPLPYKEPSPTLVNLMQMLIDATKSLATTAELPVGDGQEEMPVGTTIALIERATKVESAILKRLHVTHRRELRLLKDLFAADPAAKYPYMVNGKQGVALGADFSSVDVIPTSDPNVPSSAQRLALAQFLQVTALQAPPGTHDVRAAYENLYRTAGIADQQINVILPPKPQVMPADPVTENMNAVTNKPLAVGPEQDHLSHLTSHMAFLQSPAGQANPAVSSSLMSHVGDHVAQFYRAQVELALGHPLPPAGQKLPPDVENQIAMAVAQVSGQVSQALQQAAVQMGVGGPNADAHVQMMEIQQKAQEMQQKSKDAQMKAQMDQQKIVMDAQMHGQEMQDNQAERQSRENIEAMKMQQEHIRNQGMEQQAAIAHQEHQGALQQGDQQIVQAHLQNQGVQAQNEGMMHQARIAEAERDATGHQVKIAAEKTKQAQLRPPPQQSSASGGSRP